MSDINLFRPFFRVEETLAEIRQCLEKGWTGIGFKTEEFEKEWVRYTGVPHAHFTSSCTAALHLALAVLKKRLGWRDGDEVVTTALTFVGTNHAILKAGLTPVFADVDPNNLCLDPTSLSLAVTNKTRAVMFVGFGGSTGRIAEVDEACQKHGLALIVDAAHMAGTRLNGAIAPSFKSLPSMEAACWSFHAVKPLPTGDSGLVAFRQPDDDARARQLGWFGINKDTYSRTKSGGTYRWEYDVIDLGDKWHGNSVMAAIALVALRHLDRDNAYRRQLAAWYDSEIKFASGLFRPSQPPGCESSRHLYQIFSDRRDELMVYLNSVGIYPGMHYKLSTSYPVYAPFHRGLRNAEDAAKRLVSLPMHVCMTIEDVRRVADAINKFHSERG